jgi:hypothetical protein
VSKKQKKQKNIRMLELLARNWRALSDVIIHPRNRKRMAA